MPSEEIVTSIGIEKEAKTDVELNGSVVLNTGLRNLAADTLFLLVEENLLLENFLPRRTDADRVILELQKLQLATIKIGLEIILYLLIYLKVVPL